MKCLVILSAKSSGSSVCQNLLAALPTVRHVARTRHSQFETLYWTKAASILGRPQIPMLGSEVPLPSDRARRDLVRLLEDNLGEPIDYASDQDLIFDGWRRLCRRFSPVFLEKSPHHLLQWSALELIIECTHRLRTEVEFAILGLVRNPLATLYSGFRRFHTIPEEGEAEWITCYRNLLALRERLGDRVVVARYEDLVRSPRCLAPILAFAGAKAADLDHASLHTRSIARWSEDRWFGFRISKEGRRLAVELGYEASELDGPESRLWPLYRTLRGHIPAAARSWRRALLALGRRGQAGEGARTPSG